MKAIVKMTRTLPLIIVSLTAAVIAQGGQKWWHVPVFLTRRTIVLTTASAHAVTAPVYARRWLLVAVSPLNGARI